MKQLIQEQIHPLELLRELISNAGAEEVHARRIGITYYVHPAYGHVFVIEDGVLRGVISTYDLLQLVEKIKDE